MIYREEKGQDRDNDMRKMERNTERKLRKRPESREVQKE